MEATRIGIDHRTNKEQKIKVGKCKLRIWGRRSGTTRGPRKLTRMKMAKAIRQQALTAQRVASTTKDPMLASQMRNLAQAFRAQADTLKKNKK